MRKNIIRNLAIAATALALTAPCFAQTGCDPEPGGGIIHQLLHLIGR